MKQSRAILGKNRQGTTGCEWNDLNRQRKTGEILPFPSFMPPTCALKKPVKCLNAANPV